MVAWSGKGVKAALLAAAATFVPTSFAGAQDEAPVSWDQMTVVDFANLVRVDVPRPKARPVAFRRTMDHSPRPPARPLISDDPIGPSVPPVAALPEALAPVVLPLEAHQPPADLGPVVLPVSPPLVAALPQMPPADQTERPLLDLPPVVEDVVVAAPLPLVRTSDYASGAFWGDRAERMDAFVAAEGRDKIAAALEVSRLLMSQMLLPEARDFHRRAQSLGVVNDPELYGQWQAQDVMLSILGGDPVTAQFPQGWAEGSLWAIAGKLQGDQIGGGLHLTEAVSQLQNHSVPVISQVLPLVFDAAMEAGDLRVADALIRGAREATNLAGEPVYHYMTGRLQLAYDLPQAAFDAFVEASKGRDIHAQRARIAMADLAIARKDPKLLPALSEILAEGVNQWRHGREGLILRARLAQVAEDLGNIPLALDIMGKIRQDHPGTAEAILAHERGALALAAFAVAVDKGEIDLQSYMQTLRNVEAFYRLDPIWPIGRTALARAWARLGLHEAAASEYAALQTDLQRLGAPAPLEKVAQEIPIAEAESWLANSDLARARVALARNGLPRFEELTERYAIASLRAEVTGALGEMMAFSDAEGFRVYAHAARNAGLKAQATAAHRELDKRRALGPDLSEAIHATLIARDLGDKAFMEASFAALQGAEGGPQTAAVPALNEALTLPMPPLQPLSHGTADEMLARTDAALQASRDLLARPLRGEPSVSSSPRP